MKIVIDIDENLYTRLYDNGVEDYDDAVDMAKAIRKGTPIEQTTNDDIETMRILFDADINEYCNQGRWNEAKEYKQIRDRLMTALKKTNTAEWIPVTERLPKPFTLVNATCRSLVDDREDWVIETLYLPIPKEANKNGYSDWGNIPMLNWGEAEVIAWVERIIPEPYKAESEEEE